MLCDSYLQGEKKSKEAIIKRIMNENKNAHVIKGFDQILSSKSKASILKDNSEEVEINANTEKININSIKELNTNKFKKEGNINKAKKSQTLQQLQFNSNSSLKNNKRHPLRLLKTLPHQVTHISISSKASDLPVITENKKPDSPTGVSVDSEEENKQEYLNAKSRYKNFKQQDSSKFTLINDETFNKKIMKNFITRNFKTSFSDRTLNTTTNSNTTHNKNKIINISKRSIKTEESRNTLEKGSIYSDESESESKKIKIEMNINKLDLDLLQKGIEEILNDSEKKNDEGETKRVVTHVNSVKNVIININQNPIPRKFMRLNSNRINRNLKLERENLQFFKRLNSISPIKKKYFKNIVDDFQFLEDKEKTIKDLKQEGNKNTLKEANLIESQSQINESRFEKKTLSDMSNDTELKDVHQENEINEVQNDFSQNCSEDEKIEVQNFYFEDSFINEMVESKVGKIFQNLVSNYREDSIILKHKRERLSLDFNQDKHIKLDYNLSDGLNRRSLSVHSEMRKYFKINQSEAQIQVANIIKVSESINQLNKIKKQISDKINIKSVKNSEYAVLEEKEGLMFKVKRHINSLLNTRKKELDYVKYKRKLLKFYRNGFKGFIISEIETENKAFAISLSSHKYVPINKISFINEYLNDKYFDYQKKIIKSIYIEAFNEDLEINKTNTFLSNFSLNHKYEEIIPIRELIWQKYQIENGKKKFKIRTEENRRHYNKYALLDHMGVVEDYPIRERYDSIRKKAISEHYSQTIRYSQNIRRKKAEYIDSSFELDERSGKEDTDGRNLLLPSRILRTSQKTQKAKRTYSHKLKKDKQQYPYMDLFMDKFSILKNNEFFIQNSLKYHFPELMKLNNRRVNLSISKKRRITRRDTLKEQTITDKWTYARRTNEIKAQMFDKLSKPFDILRFFLDENNVVKFKNYFDKSKIGTETKDKKGNTLLNLAVQIDSEEVVKFLIEMNADVNTQNYELNTPLHYALSRRNFKLANLLISNKADEIFRNKRLLTPWQCLGLGIDY